jgi:hypothetical protein
LTETRASGEILGPNSTRSQKPAAITARPKPEPARNVIPASSTTRPAVILAAYSFTGLGKANTARQSIPRGRGEADSGGLCWLLMQQG